MVDLICYTKFIFSILYRMNLFVTAHYYKPRYLAVVENGDVNIYKYETCMFDKAFLCFQTKNLFIGKS